MPGAITKKKNLYLCKSVDELHKLSEIKPLTNNVQIIIRSAAKVFKDAEKLDNEGDQEKALIMYMKYFNILKQVKSKADYKKQKAYYDNLIGRKNQEQAIERAEVLNESLRERYDYQQTELLAKKLSPITSTPEEKVSPKVQEISAEKDKVDSITKSEATEKTVRPNFVTCMQLCDMLRDNDSKLILMDLRTSSDFAQSHVSHSECISVPEDCILPGSTVNHIEPKLSEESKVVWKTRKNVDYIILIDWNSKIDDVKVGTPIQTLKDALYKFDTSVIISSEPLVLEGGYRDWLVFYPTMTTNPHIALPHHDDETHTDRTPSPTLTLDFDYPELDENLKEKKKPAPIVLPNNTELTMPDNNSDQTPALPRIDRSLKPSLNNKQPLITSVGGGLEQARNNASMYPALIPQPKTLNGQNEVNVNRASPPITNKSGPKQINLSVKNNLFEGKVRQADLKNTKTLDSERVARNGRLQEDEEKAEEVERKLQELELLKKKKEYEVADLMRKERKIKAELEMERLKREENDHLLAMEEEKKRRANLEQEKENEEKQIRLQTVERMRTERKKEEEEGMMKQQEEEQKRFEAEKEELRMREEQKAKELAQLEEQKRMEEEEKEKIAREMLELEKAKAERLKREELRRMEEEKRLESERQEHMRKEEERNKKEQMEKEAMEEARKAKENAERKLLVEMKNKDTNASDQKREKVVPTTNLPTGWEKRLDKDTNRCYYIDHNRGVTTWIAPTGIAKGTFTTKLKEEPAPTLSRGLSRSHSSPNIMKELAEEEKAMARKPTVIDRASKPNNRLKQSMYSMRKRDLNPVYGNVNQGLTGLRNLGNTCYMNSTIQCLNNTSPLITYFLSDNYHQDINRESSQGMHGEVVDDFAVVIKALWSGQYRSITPRDLKSTVSKYNPLFAGYQQQDSQEFLTFLLDGLHEGLNEVKKAPDIPEQNNDNLSDEKGARLAWEHHKLLHRSVIVELFQGQLKSTLRCRFCGKKSVTFQAFMFLSLPIPASSRCTLKDCIQEFLKPEMMTGSCKWKCTSCKVERDSEKKIDIWKLPPILLVGLNRFYSDGMWMQKKTTYVDFPIMDVDFSPYILGPPPRNRYNLYGISNHYGTMEGGHYTAICRNPVTTRWYKFDDQDVSEISKSDIKTSAGFVLYYTSIEMSAPQNRIGI